MATEVILKRDGARLIAADPISADAIKEIGQDEQVRAVITRPRNVQHHRLFFALMQEVFANQTRYPTLEQLLDAVKIGIGHYDEYKLDGHTVMKPRSISFTAMDQTAFKQFYDRVVDLVITAILPGVKKKDLENRINEIIGGRGVAA